MRIEILKAFGPYSVGAILPDVPPNQARGWIGRNLAREVADEQPAKAAAVSAPVDRQMKSGKRTDRRDYATR